MRYLLQNLLIGIVISVLLTIIFVTIDFSDTGEFSSMDNILLILKYNALYSIVLAIVNGAWFDYVKRRGVYNKNHKYRIVLVLVGSVVITLISVFFIRMYHELAWANKSFAQFIDTEVPNPYIIATIISVFVGLIYHSVIYYKEKQRNRVKEQTIIAGTASAKFVALKNQLDPHFLFNSLNVLTSLIDENPKQAQKFTTALSKVYRYVLEQKNKDLVTVDQELDFARSYMSLLKMRFEDSIVFDIPTQSTNPENKVVPLSLQLLLENAVKHNVVTSSRPLHIRIFEENGNLVVENNLQIKQIVKKSTGVGLSNIRQRYQLLTKRNIKINEQNNNFSVAIPMLSKEISVMRTTPTKFNDNYVRARKHVDELKEFYYSLISYFFVIPFLIFINYKTYWGFQWFWFPMFGWGISLVFQAYKLFVNDGILGRNWEKKRIEKYLREEEQKSRFR